MISYRGILAALIGLAFLYVGADPDRLTNDPMPWFLRGILLLVGAMLVAMGAVLFGKVFRAGKLVRSHPGTPGEVVIFPEKDAECGARALHVRTEGACFALAMDMAGTPGPPLDDAKVRPCEIWIEPGAGKVAAVAVNGNRLNLILGAKPIDRAQFGQP